MKYNCNKTQKRRLSKNGIAILAKNDHNIEGKIYVKETSLGLTIDYDIIGLSDGLHGFHIHETADFSNGCLSTGECRQKRFWVAHTINAANI